MLVKLAYRLLRVLLSKELTLAERNLFTNLVLDKINALPLHDMIAMDEMGNLLIDGKAQDIEMMRLLHAHANSALENRAEKLVDEQVKRAAVVHGLHNGDTPEKILFYRAAIWFAQQRENFLRLLAGRDQQSDL